jgi:hypothetical protein
MHSVIDSRILSKLIALTQSTEELEPLVARVLAYQLM